MKSLTYIEIDIPICTRVYGLAPCVAAIGVTGAQKCFNTKRTCQDRAHYNEDEVTLRFARDAAYLPRDIDCIPSIDGDVAFTPGTISLGENLGTRSTLQVTFRDHPHSDAGEGFDPYFDERAYDPFRQGTLFGKFRARQPYLRGRSIRWISGLVGQSLGEMVTRHFVVESFDGPTPDGKFTMIAKDVLKLLDGDRAQAPAMSTGYLAADITAAATGLTLLPTGVGDAEYSGGGYDYIVIGGNELAQFTRVGNVVTLSNRGQLGTAPAAHRAQDRVQRVLEFAAQDPADIIYSLMVNYAGVPAAFINLSEWKAETGSFLGRLYSSVICEPTSVATLINELIAQACLSIWWDDRAQKIRLQVLRGIVTDATRFTPENTLQGSLTVREQPEKRLSQVWVYFGRINPLKALTDVDNYRSVSVTIDEAAEEDYDAPVIAKIMSRWIPALGRTVADRLGAIQLGRFRDPPRRFQFDTQRYAATDLQLGVGYRISAASIQDATGAMVDAPVQITRLNSPPDRWKGEAEEILFDAPPENLIERLIIVDANNFNINLREQHDSLYPPASSGDTVTCRINPGVLVGSVSTSAAAFNVGLWPSGVNIVLINRGAIIGAGGAGGAGGGGGNSGVGATGGQDGAAGGTALYTRRPISLQLPGSSLLWGGGGGGAGGGGYAGSGSELPGVSGGGGGGGGGGGAGLIPGAGGTGNYGSGGSGTAGGSGNTGAPSPGGFGGNQAGNGGPGGGAGLAGNGGNSSPTNNGGFGGPPGPAIDGNSYVTLTDSGGDRRGPLIN